MNCGQSASQGCHCEGCCHDVHPPPRESASGLTFGQGISKERRRAPRAKHVLNELRRGSAAPLRALPLQLRGEKEAGARRGRHALADAAFASRFGNGLTLQATGLQGGLQSVPETHAV